jgi:glutamate dehydrogenase (NAD(P)+)
VVCDRAAAKLGLAPRECRVIIQGFGNVGSGAAHHLHARGYRVVGIAEFDGGLWREDGLDIPALMEYRGKNKTIHGFPGAERVDSAELITRACEVLVPAATENVITSKNAASLRCRILCEGANGPTTLPADEILAANGIFVVPDILANAGGVTASYFEWVQDRMGYFWTEEEVNTRLDRIMTDSFRDVVAYADAHSVNNRIAAYMLAIDRVAYTTHQRGMYA